MMVLENEFLYRDYEMSYLQVGVSVIVGAIRATKLNVRQIRDAPEPEFRRGRYIKSIHEIAVVSRKLDHG